MKTGLSLKGDCVPRNFSRLFQIAVGFGILVICWQLAACGGSSKVTPLTIGTTSLPDGSVGVTYAATLSAFGGTPPYKWAQTSGGDMPGGVTLGSTGNFLGTPTTAGSFGPYVFTVTDSAGATAASQSLSINISPATFSVTTSVLPNGTVGATYSATLVASGGAPPYTWAEASGGDLPAGISRITSEGVIAGTPTTAGAYGPYVFTATDSKGATASSANLTLTVSASGASACAPVGNEAALSSANPYAFLLKGTDGNGNPIDIAGSFTPNGTGGISSAVVDYNGFSNGPQVLLIDVAGSSYSFSSSQQGCLYLSFSGLGAMPEAISAGATNPGVAAGQAVRVRSSKSSQTTLPVPVGVQFAFGLSGWDGSVYRTGRIMESDNADGTGTNASGFLHVQDPSAFSLSSLQTNYAFGVDGWTAATSGVVRTALAGTFANGSGTLTAGYSDVNTGGTASGEVSGGYGSLSTTVDTTSGRGTGSYFIKTPAGSISFGFAFYILDASDVILQSTTLASGSSTTPLLAGRAVTSNASYLSGALNGYYLLAWQGLESRAGAAKNLVAVGTMNATDAGTIPTATVYANDAGTYSSTPYPSSSYAVEATTGRVSFTGLTSTPPVAYLTAGGDDGDGIAGFVVGTDAQASSGVIVTQTTGTPNYGPSSVSGSYAASTAEDVDGANGAFFGSFSFNGTGAYTVTPLVTGSVPNVPHTGEIGISSDGSGSLDGGAFPFVTNGEVLFAIPDSGDPLLFVFTGPLPTT